MLSKKTEYVIAGALALYIVFATRPAPTFVASLLASPVAQVAALAAVIYVGATQSLVVAIVAGLALVLSTPSREYMTDKKPAASEKKKPKKSLKEASEKVSAAAVPTESSKEPEAAGHTVSAPGSKENTTSALKTEHFANVSA